MGDTKQGRVKKAREEERRQREHELQEALERGDEPTPEPAPTPDLEGLDGALAEYTYPIRTVDLIDAEGDRTVTSPRGQATIGALLGVVPDDSFDSAEAVRSRLAEQLAAD